MDDAMGYETFIRWSFGFANDGAMLDRFGDPAQAASTDRYYAENLPVVKAAVAYGMLILVGAVRERHADGLPDDESKRLDTFVPRVIDARSLAVASALIQEFEKTVSEKYFTRAAGKTTLK